MAQKDAFSYLEKRAAVIFKQRLQILPVVGIAAINQGGAKASGVQRCSQGCGEICGASCDLAFVLQADEIERHLRKRSSFF